MNVINVTPLVARYRDAARTLWNSGFLPLWESDADFPGFTQMSDWDFRDRFEDLCVELFSALVLAPAGAPSLKIWPAYRGDAVPLSELRVIPNGNVELLVAESEGNSFQSYDRELTNSRDVELDMRFLSFFDYDVRNIRDLEYCHAVIVAHDERPQYVGRNVLVRSGSAVYELSAP